MYDENKALNETPNIKQSTQTLIGIVLIILGIMMMIDGEFLKGFMIISFAIIFFF